MTIKTRKIEKLFNVYIGSGSTKYTLLENVSRHEAHRFCEDNQWCFKDENDFVWDMDYEEC